MIRSILLALALVAGVSSFAPGAQAQVFVVASCSATGLNQPLGFGGRLVSTPDGVQCTNATTSGTSSGSVTAAGTNGSQAQAVQGINGGVPLTTTSTQAVFYSDLSTATAVSTTYNGAVRDLGASPTYTRLNAGGNSTQAGTLNILGCYDSGCSGTFIMASSAVSAGGSVAISVTAITRYWRVSFVNGTTAGAANVSSSATAN